MSFFFNRTAEKKKKVSGKTPDPGAGHEQEITPPASSEKQGDNSHLLLIRSSLESKAETGWYSHHNHVQKNVSSVALFPPHYISVRIGEFLQRIPQNLLNDGPFDSDREVQLNVWELLVDITNRKPSVSLSAIARSCPEIFLSEITPEQDAEIYFPWHSVVDQILAFCALEGAKLKNAGLNRTREAAPSKPEEPVTHKPEPPPVESGAAEAVVSPGLPAKQDASDAPASGVEQAVAESRDLPSAGNDVTLEKVVQERDLAVQQRDAAVAEVERLKVALRHASEALEMLCKTGKNDGNAD